MAKTNRTRSAPKKAPSQKKAAPPPIPLTVHDRLVLQSVRFIETFSKLNIVNNEIPLPLETKLEVNFGGLPEDGKLLGNFRVTLANVWLIKLMGDEDAKDEALTKKSSLVIRLVAQCVFGVQDGGSVTSFTEEDSAAIQQMIAFVCWPYIRQFVCSLTASMSLPPVTLPLMRIHLVPPPKTSEKTKSPE